MQLKDSELAILWLLKKDGKLRWEDLVKKSGYSRRWVHKNIRGLVETGFVEREQDRNSNQYPPPVYYSLADLPPEVETRLKLFEAAKQFTEPFTHYQRIIKAISVGLGSSVRSVQEFSLAYENATKKVDEIARAVGKSLDAMKPLIDDLEKAADSGELSKEILEAPLDEAVRTFLTHKVRKGELPPEILALPLREAIQKYQSARDSL